jgi:hypothetical protein
MPKIAIANRIIKMTRAADPNPLCVTTVNGLLEKFQVHPVLATAYGNEGIVFLLTYLLSCTYSSGDCLPQTCEEKRLNQPGS